MNACQITWPYNIGYRSLWPIVSIWSNVESYWLIIPRYHVPISSSLKDIRQNNLIMKYRSWSDTDHCLQYIFPSCFLYSKLVGDIPFNYLKVGNKWIFYSMFNQLWKICHSPVYIFVFSTSCLDKSMEIIWRLYNFWLLKNWAKGQRWLLFHFQSNV